MSYLEGLFMEGGVNVVFLDGNHGLADIIQSREIWSGLNRIYGEGNVNLISYDLLIFTLMFAAPSGRTILRVKFSATMVSKS